MNHRGCKACNYTGWRIYLDHRGREVSARCVCNPAPAPKKAKAAQPAQPAQENLLDPDESEWRR